MRVNLAAAATIASLCLSIVGAAPAVADIPFNPPPMQSLISLLPDTCIPTGTSAYCITFTNATFSTGLAMLDGQSQMGSMFSQNMQGVTFGSLASQLGIADPSKSQAQQGQVAAGAANPQSPGDAEAAYLQQMSGQSASDLNGLLNGLYGPQTAGALSAAQMQGTIMLKLAGAQEQANQLAAAAQLQRTQQARAALQMAGSLLDLNNPNPTAGWSF